MDSFFRQKEYRDMFLQKTQLEFGGPICRRCFDRRYGVHLAHRDVKEVPGTCPCCGKDGKLVVDLKLGGRLKMMGKW